MKISYFAFNLGLCLCVFISGGLSWGSPQNLDRISAIVGSQAILHSEVINFKNELSANKALANIYRIDASKLSFQEVLNRMIEELIIQQAAKDAEVSVADSEIETQIGNIAQQNGLTKNQLVEQLKIQKISYESYKKNIRAQLEKRNIFDREIRKGALGGAQDLELRSLYNQKAPKEYKLSLLSLKTNKANKALLSSYSNDVREGRLSIEKLVNDSRSTPLGWISPESLQKPFQKALSKGKLGQAIGPVDIKGQSHLILFEAERRGSEEGYQLAKGELQASLQGQDFERRFSLWIERKKKDMQIVVNEK